MPRPDTFSRSPQFGSRQSRPSARLEWCNRRQLSAYDKYTQVTTVSRRQAINTELTKLRQQSTVVFRLRSRREEPAKLVDFHDPGIWLSTNIHRQGEELGKVTKVGRQATRHQHADCRSAAEAVCAAQPGQTHHTQITAEEYTRCTTQTVRRHAAYRNTLLADCLGHNTMMSAGDFRITVTKFLKRG